MSQNERVTDWETPEPGTPIADLDGAEESSAEDASLQARFETLVREWNQGTAVLSSSTAIRTHPAYLAIIALGSPVVPLILRDLERQPSHWFDALRELTGEDPVPRADWGKIQAMQAAWLAWGRSRGLLEE